MVRGVIAAGLCVALQVGALCAPLLHAHLDHHDGDRHASPLIHSHFSAHEVDHHDEPAAARRVHSGDEADEVSRLQVFIAVTAAAATAPAVPVGRFVLPSAPASMARRPLDVVRSHGPPPGSPAGSRAPPAFPS